MNLTRRGLLLNGLGASLSALALPAMADAPTLRIGDQRGSTRALLKAAGQLDRVPYGLEWGIFPVGAPVLEAINAGAIDFGYVGDAAATFALAAGAPIKTINVWQRRTGTGAGVPVPAASPLHSVADLRGERVAVVRGASGHLLVVAALIKAGFSPKDVNFVFLSAADSKAALISGSVDAWAIWDPYLSTGVLRDHMRILFDTKGLLEEVECGVASLTAIATRRPQLLDFLTRVRRAYQWTHTHKADYARAYAADTDVPLDIAQYVTGNSQTDIPQQIPDRSIALHQQVADLYLKIGLISKPLDISKAYDRSFVLPA